MMTKRRESPWQVETRSCLTENTWFSVVQQKVRNPSGNQCDYFTVEFAAPSVGIIARRSDRYLLIHQYRFIVDEYVWAIPSGGVDEGEKLIDAARRELLEETGYVAGNLEHLFGYYPSYGATNQRFELFLADEVQEAGARYDPNETLKVGWFDREQVVDMILGHQIVDGLSLTPLAVILFREEISKCRPG